MDLNHHFHFFRDFLQTSRVHLLCSRRENWISWQKSYNKGEREKIVNVSLSSLIVILTLRVVHKNNHCKIYGESFSVIREAPYLAHALVHLVNAPVNHLISLKDQSLILQFANKLRQQCGLLRQLNALELKEKTTNWIGGSLRSSWVKNNAFAEIACKGLLFRHVSVSRTFLTKLFHQPTWNFSLASFAVLV